MSSHINLMDGVLPVNLPILHAFLKDVAHADGARVFVARAVRVTGKVLRECQTLFSQCSAVSLQKGN